MSEWYEANISDIEIDVEAKEVSVFVMNNHNGNVYVTISFDQIERIYNSVIAVQYQGKQ